MTPQGYSLHIGLNHVDAAHYAGIPTLKAAVNDALDWEAYARTLGYQTQHLHDAAATTTAVTSTLADLAKKMRAGDILLLTYAGHGGQVPNEKPQGFDRQTYDQTWCLYDRQLLDDEIYECLKAFPEGARVMVVSDSCHSGTVTRVEGEINLGDLLNQGMVRSATGRGHASRLLPSEVVDAIAYQFLDLVYRPLIQKFKLQRKGDGVKAAVKLLAACQDHQQTYDGPQNGIFTAALLEIVQNAQHQNDTCETLLDLVKTRYAFPNPNFFQYGAVIESFDRGFPFKIDLPDADKVSGFRDPDEAKANGSNGVVAPNPDWDDNFTAKSAAQLWLSVDNPRGDKILAGNDVSILRHDRHDGKDLITIELPTVTLEQGWNAAHALQTALQKNGYTASVEPILSVNATQRTRPITREGDKDNPEYIPEWPPADRAHTPEARIGWHLDEHHSQLAKAREAVRQRPGAHLNVRIAHLDTGYLEGHVALPTHLDTARARSFVSKDPDPNKAIDYPGSGQDGHGTGTITLLAGRKAGLENTFNEYDDEIGGAPFAEVLPLRISDSVVILNSENFCDAVYYAIEQGCEVISMSMAGKPSHRMALAVNAAYEAGIVVVSAASNCWYKGLGQALPKCVLYPAAFERVIAATGALYNHEPYDVKFLLGRGPTIGTKYMQGCWGPASRMTRALAAYTPNVPWASSHFPFVRSGGGTSSATPQVAAAAALWIAYHRKELIDKGFYNPGNQWKKVEAVRRALFQSAAKGEVFAEWQKYYGNGIVRAYDALQVGVPDEGQLQKAPSAESSYFGLWEVAGSLFKNRRLFRDGGPAPEAGALTLELLHLLQSDPQFSEAFSVLDLSDQSACAALLNDAGFQQQVLASPYASDFLKAAFAA